MITAQERQVAIALLVTILEKADTDLVGEIVTTSVHSLLQRWTQETRAIRVTATGDKPLTYAGAWRAQAP
jgi:hypothetical protein